MDSYGSDDSSDSLSRLVGTMWYLTRVSGGCGYFGVKKALSGGQKMVNVVVVLVCSAVSKEERVLCKIMDMAT